MCVCVLGGNNRGGKWNCHSTSLFTIHALHSPSHSYFLFSFLSLLLSFPPLLLLLLFLYLLPHLPFQISISYLHPLQYFCTFLKSQKWKSSLRDKKNKVCLHRLRIAVCVWVRLLAKVTTCTTIKRGRKLGVGEKDPVASNITSAALRRTHRNVGMFTPRDS